MIKFLSQERLSKIKEIYQVADYQIIALDILQSYVKLSGKKVLEIGGSNLPRELIFEDLKCEKWVSVDVVDPSHYALKRQVKHYQSETLYNLSDADTYFDIDPYVIFNGFAENIPLKFYNYFDVVVSIASFEHIAKLSTVIQKIYNSLKDNGFLYSRFAPIWSGNVGHHLWVSKDLNCSNLGAVPKFGHLLMRPFEMFNYLRDFYSPEICEEVVHQLYFSDRINRLFYEDYESVMSFTDFKRHKCKPTGVSTVEDETVSKLKTLYPHCNRFDAYGMEIIAYK